MGSLRECYAHRFQTVSYTHLRAHETGAYLVCRLLLENKEKVQYPVATTLFFRYLKRIVSHIVNAATALIMPTDKIDYLDE